MANYLEILQKIQDQTLDNVKQIQAAQVATLTTAREIIAELATAKDFPTFAQITELGTSFATQVLDQQKAFASQVADVMTQAVESNPSVKSTNEKIGSVTNKAKDDVQAGIDHAKGEARQEV
jgi:TRAP-type mannitol/chloroaromatic compound transport system substrate-binding protein